MDLSDPSKVTERTSRNVRNVAELEKRLLGQRSRSERIGHWITMNSARLSVILLHVVWFAFWIVWNSGVFPGARAFDPFPFTFLNSLVSLEAIFLTYFVLMGQKAQTTQEERWAHLDLQVNILAEQEMTEALRMLTALCNERGLHAQIGEQVGDMVAHTEVETLAAALDEQRTTT